MRSLWNLQCFVLSSKIEPQNPLDPEPNSSMLTNKRLENFLRNVEIENCLGILKIDTHGYRTWKCCWEL